MGEQNRALAAEFGELLDGIANGGGVLHVAVVNVVHGRGFGRNHHVRLHECFEFAEQLGHDFAVLCFYGELDCTDFNDFIFLVVKTCSFKVEGDKFRGH